MILEERAAVAANEGKARGLRVKLDALHGVEEVRWFGVFVGVFCFVLGFFWVLVEDGWG